MFGSDSCLFGVRTLRTIGGPSPTGDPLPTPATPGLAELAGLSTPRVGAAVWPQDLIFVKLP